MHKPSEMNVDPLAEKLSRFSPDMAGLDRDALLFQAGRASARPRRFWPVVAGVLAVSQTATLLFFLTRNVEPTAPVAKAAPEAAAPADAPEASQDPGLWSLRKSGEHGNNEETPKKLAPNNMMVANQVFTILSISAGLREVDESASSAAPAFHDSQWSGN